MRSVSSAAGINPDRGDTISVEPLPFSTEARDRRAAAEQEARDREAREFYLKVGIPLLILLLIAGSIYWYKRKKRLEREAIEEARRQEELAAQRAEEEARALAVAAGQVQEEELTEEEKQQISERQALLNLIDNKPAEVAMLIKTWLAEDE